MCQIAQVPFLNLQSELTIRETFLAEILVRVTDTAAICVSTLVLAVARDWGVMEP